MTITASPTSAGSSRDDQPRRRWPWRLAAVARIAVGLVFLTAGLPKFTGHQIWLRQFQHWQVPLPALSVYAVGGLEVVGGVLLVLGIGSTLLAVLFVVDMTGALAFAGTKDGGTFIVEPLVFGVACLLMALFGAGAWQLRPLPTVVQLRSALQPSMSGTIRRARRL